MPLFATVAYAPAMASGETLLEPMMENWLLTSTGSPVLALVTPILVATFSMSHRSSCSAIAKKPEFSDCAVNCMGVPVYPPPPPKFATRVPLC